MQGNKGLRRGQLIPVSSIFHHVAPPRSSFLLLPPPCGGWGIVIACGVLRRRALPARGSLAGCSTADDEMNRRVRRNPMLALCRLVAALAGAVLLLSWGACPAAEPIVQLAPNGLQAKGPLAWWRLDEGTGNAVHDATGHGFEGLIRGTARWVEGPSGKALSFDGHTPQGTVAFHEGFKADGQQPAPICGSQARRS